LNLGAGVQSTTLYLMAVRGELSIDCAIFADLREEPAPVYRHLEWLQGLNGPAIHVVSAGSLGDDLQHGKNSTGQRFASIPAWVAPVDLGKPGRVRRQCTSEYKIEPIERFIRRTLLGLRPRQWMPKNTRISQLFGISIDEAGRAYRIRGNAPFWSVPEFPLIDRSMTRADCIGWLRSFGVPHPVPRSACVFCPYKGDDEWTWLRDNDPKGFARAVEIDDALRREGVVVNRNMDRKLYLHRSCVPLRDVSFSNNKSDFSLDCEGGCGL